MNVQQRIRRVSRLMQAVALICIALLPIYQVLAWFMVDSLLQTLLAHRGIRLPVGEIGGTQRALGFLVQAVPIVLLMVVLSRMYRLFVAYGRAEVFTPTSIATFHAMARTLFLFAMVNPVAGALLSVIVTSSQAPGHRQLVIGFGGPEIAALIMGGALTAIGWVMVQARDAADENSQIV